MYTINEYGIMIADRERTDAYAAALEFVVNPDSVVLEVGTGTGFFAMLACRYGAKKVYAIEPNDAIAVAQKLARENGCTDRILFIQDVAKNINLAEKATVVISDMRGRLPLFGLHLPCIIDVRRRLLAPEAVMIPARDSLWATLVASPSIYRELVTPWQEKNHAINMQSVRQLAINNFVSLRASCPDEEVLVEPQCWAKLDYYTINDSDVSGHMSWRVEQDGCAHGIKVWFDTILTDEIGFSNAISRPDKIYGNLFFPWPREVLLRRGDEITVSLKASLIGEDYVWCWNSCIRSCNGARINEAVFEQSTFKGTPLSLPRIKRRSENYRPVLNKEGLIDKQILQMMDEGQPLRDIAQVIFKQFPDDFPDYKRSLNHVGKLSLKYSK